MTTVAVTHLRSALEAINIAGHPLDLDIDQLRRDVSMALAAIQQQPGVFDDIGLHARLRREIEKHGSMAAAARAWGIDRQVVVAVMNADRACPPSILAAIGMVRVGQRRLYREA
jgi:hypothetical protein